MDHRVSNHWWKETPLESRPTLALIVAFYMAIPYKHSPSFPLFFSPHHLSVVLSFLIANCAKIVDYPIEQECRIRVPETRGLD